MAQERNAKDLVEQAERAAVAGDLAAAELGQVAMIASDLLKFLATAFKSLTGAPVG